GIFPTVPQSSKGEQFAVANLEAERLLPFYRAHPLVETVCRDQAPTEFQGVAEGGLCGGCLLLRGDRAHWTGRVFCPMWDKSLLHCRKLPNRFLRMLADHRNRLSWGNIEPRIPVLFPRGSVEILLD